jgi:uncharacterized OB-fold protein
MEGSNHSDCGIRHFPPARICPDCNELGQAVFSGGEAGVLALFDFVLRVSSINVGIVEEKREGMVKRLPNPERGG